MFSFDTNPLFESIMRKTRTRDNEDVYIQDVEKYRTDSIS